MPATQKRCAVIETALGWIGIGWSEIGVEHLLLPEHDRERIETRLLTRSGAEIAQISTDIGPLVDDLRRYADGERVRFDGARLSFGAADDFSLAVYEQARKLDYGETTTYGALAEAAGYPGMARETGQALGANPVPILVPCHRIVAAGGKMGGFSAPGGVVTKRRLLDMEHAVPPSPPGQAAFAF